MTEIPCGVGGGAGEGLRWWLRGNNDLTIHCHHQNDFCIEVGSDENHFYVTFIANGAKSHDGVHKLQFLKRKESRSESQMTVCTNHFFFSFFLSHFFVEKKRAKARDRTHVVR